jgi:pilus assembly protein CpaE
MNISWFYFSDTNTPPGEIKAQLEKRDFLLQATNQLERLNNLLGGNDQSVLFIKSNTLYNVYDLCQEISISYPHVYIILIVPDNMENLKKAMLLGASDLLRSSFNRDELSEAIEHAKKFMNHRANKEHSFTNLLKADTRVIAISSPKGGIGRTLTTVNLAAAFARMGKKTAIIDANLQFGEVAVFLNIKPKRTIYEWVKEGYGRDNYTIDQYMHTDDKGIAVLASPPRPEFFEGITEKHVRTVIDLAKKQFDVVLIDMPSALSEIHLSCLDAADEILLLTMNEISVIRICKLYLEMLESIKLKDKVKLIINRQLKGQGLEVKKLVDILGLQVFCTLPEQTTVASSSIKLGEPFILSNSRSQLGKALWNLTEMLAEQFIEDVPVKKKDKRWFLIGK